MFYACIPLFSYMGTNLGQMPAAAALRLLRLRLRLRLEIPAADRGTLLPSKKGNVYFRYFFNFSKKSRLFLYDLLFFRNFTKILVQKNRFFFDRGHFDTQKKG